MLILNDPENEFKVTKILLALKFALLVHPCKLRENPSIGSRDISIGGNHAKCSRDISILVKFQQFKYSSDLEHEFKVTKIVSALTFALLVHQCKYGENPSIESRDIVHSRI